MADVQPLRTLRYEPAAVGSLEAVIAPPYDVIDDDLRAELAARSPFNVVVDTQAVGLDQAHAEVEPPVRKR